MPRSLIITSGKEEVADLSNGSKLQLVNSFAGSSDLPSLDPEYHRGWFVRQAVKGKLCRYRASEAELNHISLQLLAYFYATADDEAQFLREREQFLEVMWPWFKSWSECNKGLVNFMREYGVYSRYFIPLLKCVPGALALCPAFGECLDIFGQPQKIPKTDKLYHFAQKDEMYAFARLRAEDAKPALEKAQRILVLGAGTLQEVRQTRRFSAALGRQFDEPWLIAYDSDTELKKYYAAVLDNTLEDYGVDFRYADFLKDLCDPKNLRAYELIGLWGVASYLDHGDGLEQLLAKLKRLLTENGVIKFDLQVLDAGPKFRKRFWQHTLVFDKVIMGWESNMNPAKSISDAIRRVEGICARVGLKVDYYKYDERNQIGIVFQCSHL